MESVIYFISTIIKNLISLASLPIRSTRTKTEVLLLTTQKNIEKGPGNKYGKKSAISN